MSNDFKTLIAFLERFEPEVSGKVLLTPDNKAQAKLQRFAAGACSQDERAQVCEMLRLHPTWLRWLADRVRMARNTAEPAR